MHKKQAAVLFLIALAIGFVFPMTAIIVPAESASLSRGFSIATMEPDAARAIRAKGRNLPNPFPNSANRGRKINPKGSIINRLTTAAQQKVLVIFVDFTTSPPGGPATRLNLSYFDHMLFGTSYDPPEYAAYTGHPTDRTLFNYYKEVSYGLVSIVTLNMPSVMGWAASGHSYDYYCRADGTHDNGFGPYPENVQGLVVDAVNAVDSFVDFSQYAVSGVVPNLFVVFAGTGAEWSGALDIIWSHSWDLTEGTGLSGYVVDGVKINNYAMMPEVGGDLTGYTGVVSGPFPPTVGVYAHEYGHVLGLPDEYDYGYESEGTGFYSLMASGSWGRYPANQIFSGNSPAHPDAWGKIRLGFVEPQLVTSLTSATLPPVETDPVVYKMIVPNSGGKEYFLLENRQQISFDQCLLRTQRWDSHGLAIYHVDDRVFTRNYWRPNEAENWKEFRSEGWRKAWTGERHYAVSLIQADDRWDLEHATNYIDSTDLYPGALRITRLGSSTRPNTSNYYYWSGSAPKFGYSGVTISNIQETGTTVTADLSFVPWQPSSR